MTPFLKQVAAHYFTQSTTSGKTFCYIFPNRRAMLFFKKFYSEEVRREEKTVFTPMMFTINDFFYKANHCSPTPRIEQLLCLYDCYKKVSGIEESLDDFLFWGDMILADFNEVDKYCVNAKSVFTNVAQFKSLQDFSYFSEKQLNAMRQFMGNFAPNLEEDGQYKGIFRKTWDLLYPLYVEFNSTLERAGKTYEGMIYRKLYERFRENAAIDILSETFNEVDTFVFIGLNALNKSEENVLRKMKKAGLAEFCWDYSSDWIKDPHNKSSFFLDKNIIEFGQNIDLDLDGLKQPEINVLTVPSAVGQTKQLAGIFDKLNTEIDINTAVVLADELLLIPTLNAIPEKIEKVNVTMGYPMSGSSIYALIDKVFSLQKTLRKSNDDYLYYHKSANDVFSNPLFKQSLSEIEKETIDKIKHRYRHYICQSEFGEGPILNLIFKPVIQDMGIADSMQIHDICVYLNNVVYAIAKNLLNEDDASLELDFAKELYEAIDTLDRYNLCISPATFYRLLRGLVGGSSVPFKGEPLQGLQIMGPLETRALDFENLIILSCNEGVFPRHNVSESFIPATLRIGFDLPTYEYQDALWAYYFYRLIQRAENVWLVLNSGTEQKMKTCEESRFIKQLELHFGVKLNRFIAKAPIANMTELDSIPKTKEHIDKFFIPGENGKVINLSASAIKDYLNCPAKFYYSKIECLTKPDEVKEFLDTGMLGSVLHKTIELIYNGHDHISKQFLKDTLKNKDYQKIVDRLILEQLKGQEINGRNLVFKELICKYVSNILSTDLRLLEQSNANSFKIIALEKYCHTIINGVQVVGFIDRLDSFTAGSVRIVDYKTGSVKDKDFIMDENTAELAFGDKNSDRPEIAFQLYLYDRFIREQDEFKDKIIKNTIYQTSKLQSMLPPEILIDNSFMNAMKERLDGTIEDILNLDLPWKKKGEEKDCSYCDFKNIWAR